MRRFTLVAGLTAVLGFVLAAPLSAGSSFPEVIPLPKGFQPEGIATKGTTFYVGALQNGAIFRGDVRTGTGSVLVPARSGRMATGMKVDRRNRLFVAGASTGQAYVYDARTGADLAFYQLTASPSFINDVIVTKSAAFFTDSFTSVLYRIPIGRNGQLGATAQPLPLIGVVSVPGQFNVNGIDATPDGETLVIVQSNTGKLFTVDPDTGVAREINLGGQNVVNGDGLLLDGRTLYVVENFDNRVAVVQLDRRLTRGTIVTFLTHPSLDIPTTVADVGRRLYIPNARFTTPATPATDYWVTQLRKPSGDDGDDEQGDNDDG
jgi:outer membrane protein assembly factor BamB